MMVGKSKLVITHVTAYYSFTCVEYIVEYLKHECPNLEKLISMFISFIHSRVNNYARSAIRQNDQHMFVYKNQVRDWITNIFVSFWYM